VPELPDIAIYLEALERRVLGQTLDRVRVASPFLLRTAQPPLTDAQGRKVTTLRRLGKRLAFGLEGDWWLVLHLMIAGRLHWREVGAPLAKRVGLAAFDFASGTLVLTEAGPGSGRHSTWRRVSQACGLTIREDWKCWSALWRSFPAPLQGTITL